MLRTIAILLTLSQAIKIKDDDSELVSQEDEGS